MKVFVFLCMVLFGVSLPLAAAEKKGTQQDQPGKKSQVSAQTPESKEAAPSRRGLTSKSVETKASRAEPFSIPREIEAQREEVEAPEIEVTGILKARGKTLAMTRLQLEKVEGKAVLEEGMRVSIPKPDRKGSESERWTTYFTVKKISDNGMEVELENGEMVWYPVMGKLD